MSDSQSFTFKKAIELATIHEMECDPNVFVLGLDVADHKRIMGSLHNVLENFGPERVITTPLSEEAMTGVTTGAAIMGMKPIHVHIRSDFLLLGMNQLVNMASCLNFMSDGELQVPATFRAIIGRGWGQGAQHSKSLHGVFSQIPGLKVILPSTPQDAYSLLRASIQEKSPVVFLEHRWLYDIEGPVDFNLKKKLETPEVIRKGNDISLFTLSWMSVESLQAAKICYDFGIDVEIIDLKSATLPSLDLAYQSVNKTGRAVISDYDWIEGGMTSNLCSKLHRSCFQSLKAPIEQVGFKFQHIPTARSLENDFYPNAKDIVQAIFKTLDREVPNLNKVDFYSYENRFKGPF